MLPPGKQGMVIWIADPGSYTLIDPVLEIENSHGQRERFTMLQRWPARMPRPSAEPLACDRPLLTGQRVLDVAFPCAHGGTCCLPSVFGCGESAAIYSVCAQSDADAVVYAMCGDRGNQVAERLLEFPVVSLFCGSATGERHPMMHRAVALVNGVDSPAAVQAASPHVALTVAEYLRDGGLNVAVVVDSVTRWADAAADAAARRDEFAADPAGLAARVRGLFGRAGKVGRPRPFGSQPVPCN